QLVGLIETATPQDALEVDTEGYAPSVAKRLAFYQRAGGIITQFLTAVFAFLMGGIVVGATGHNPLRVYKAIFEGAGLNWFLHFGSYHVDIPFTNHHIWFWWDTSTNHTAAYNLTQTLLTTTPLILTGLAVAFAFRCGLFNIGGQGQYLMGAIVGVYVGSRFVHMAHIPHLFLAIALAALAGAFWGAIAGFLKATVGAHEVITTIMLNWVADWGGRSDRAGWRFRLGVLDVQVSHIGFIGIAVALLGRNTGLGVGFAALLFGGLLTGTSTRSLDPNIFPPQLAGNLALMIQALVLLFIGADVLILYIWQARRKLRLPGATRAAEEAT